MTHRRFWAPPLPPLPLVGAPALMVPKVVSLPQFRRPAPDLPTRPCRPTAAERAEELRGAALKLLLHLRPPMAVAVVGAAAAPSGHLPPTIHLLLLLLRPSVAAVGVVAVVAGAVVVAVGAVVVEVAGVAATTPAQLKQKS